MMAIIFNTPFVYLLSLPIFVWLARRRWRSVRDDTRKLHYETLLNRTNTNRMQNKPEVGNGANVSGEERSP
jgi:hypothetical protein